MQWCHFRSHTRTGATTRVGKGMQAKLLVNDCQVILSGWAWMTMAKTSSPRHHHIPCIVPLLLAHFSPLTDPASYDLIRKKSPLPDLLRDHGR